jgi:hypothetical protein
MVVKAGTVAVRPNERLRLSRRLIIRKDRAPEPSFDPSESAAQEIVR